jgi:hypothetical protein
MEKQVVDDFESSVVERIKDMLNEQSSALRKHGIIRETISTNRGGDLESDYWSELAVDLWTDKDLFEVIEFFMFKENRSHASIAEITAWFREELKKSTEG